MIDRHYSFIFQFQIFHPCILVPHFLPMLFIPSFDSLLFLLFNIPDTPGWAGPSKQNVWGWNLTLEAEGKRWCCRLYWVTTAEQCVWEISELTN